MVGHLNQHADKQYPDAGRSYWRSANAQALLEAVRNAALVPIFAAGVARGVT